MESIEAFEVSVLVLLVIVYSLLVILLFASVCWRILEQPLRRRLAKYASFNIEEQAEDHRKQFESTAVFTYANGRLTQRIENRRETGRGLG